MTQKPDLRTGMLTLRGTTLTLDGGGASPLEFLLGWRDEQHGSAFSKRFEIPRQAPLQNTDLEQLDSYHQRRSSSYRPDWELGAETATSHGPLRTETA